MKDKNSLVEYELNNYLKNTKEEEVYITDDIVEFKNFYRLGTIISAISYRNLRVHIRVRYEDVYRIEKLLDKGFEHELQEYNNKMISLILSAPEVKKYWEKLHL